MNGTPEGAARPLGFWINLVDRLLDEKLDEMLIEHGVTHRQWQLLTVLSRGPADLPTLDATISPYLADNPDDPESSAEHLAELVDSDWLALHGGRYKLTESGTNVFERLSAVVTEHLTSLGAGLSEEQYAQTLAALERVARNLGWSDGPEGDIP
ncbi:MarR family winged helix-turn-helix transcriptional regulator [uncultured Schumannella sp.]|uniref:MarR family winged helix-turn-helix transcriptional regulator n=1 Tax=uncultured Schumannella sp. TaxID=1195956 RepID=UPI0025E72B41|nr:MarR family winged helix-turn-helix transcriptional regulator [uncultured Schumannella sp.]